jgi:hypothetical protein
MLLPCISKGTAGAGMVLILCTKITSNISTFDLYQYISAGAGGGAEKTSGILWLNRPARKGSP